MVSGPTLAWAASTAAVGCAASRSANSVAGRSPRIGGDDDLDVARHRGLDGAGERLAVGGEHEARRQDFDDRFQLAEVARHQRVGHRDRRVGNAGHHRGEAEQRVLEVVAGQDRDRPLGRQRPLQQRLRDGAHLRQRLRVGERAPRRRPARAAPGTRGRARPWPSAPGAASACRDRRRACAASADRCVPSGLRSTSTSAGPSSHRAERRRRRRSLSRIASVTKHLLAALLQKILQPRLGLVAALTRPTAISDSVK